MVQWALFLVVGVYCVPIVRFECLLQCLSEMTSAPWLPQSGLVSVHGEWSCVAHLYECHQSQVSYPKAVACHEACLLSVPCLLSAPFPHLFLWVESFPVLLQLLSQHAEPGIPQVWKQ
jgi:hypothetical protein